MTITQQCAQDLAGVKHLAGRALRTGKALAGRGGVFPWWLRVLYILGVQAWCPLPIDEVFLCIAVGITLCVPAYRRAAHAAWQASA